MPSAIDILQGLSQMRDEQHSAAILWHGALLALVLALIFGFRPRQHQARVALVAPLASVSVFAWSYGNPFNGTMFGLAAALLAMLGAYGPSAHRAGRAAFPAAAVGVLLIVFGWAYPELEGATSWWAALWEAPVGVIPCPTLAVVIGLALLGDGLGSTPWSLALSGLGLFYGIFGAWYLGVSIDWVLFIGAALLALEASRKRPGRTGSQK
ncbi:MAG: hypothetical protein WAU39_21225 [Polyangiales bacterium]